MTKEQTTAWAREAGVFETRYNPVVYSATPEALERFAALVAEHERKRWHKAGARAIRMAINIEREACAQWLEDVVDAPNWAEQIRARGETK